MTGLDQDIDETLAAWDGKHTALLKECLDRNKGKADLADALLQRIGSDNAGVADGASWLLKAALEDGLHLTAGQTGVLIATLPALHSKDTILHVCQIVRHLTLSGDQASQLAEWLEGLLTDKRPFLRAWSLDALVAIAAQHDDFRDPAQQALLRAQKDPAASVKARARNLT